MSREAARTRGLDPVEAAAEPLPTFSPAPLAWIAIGVVAFIVRVALLDRAALAPSEANHAFAAWQASRGQLEGSLADLGAPLLSNLMTMLVFLLGASDAGARIVPMLAGVGLALTPALLAATIGWRATWAAGLFIALSPVAVQLSRVADPATLSGLLSMVVVASTIRMLTDRPSWSPWLLASCGGLALVSSSGTLIAVVAAVVAALATWNVSRAHIAGWSRGLTDPAARPLWATGGLVVVVAGTAVFTDLRGIGFAFGDIWGGAASMLAPAPFPSRNLGAMLAYAGPLLALALVGFIRGARRGDRITLFLGEWSLLLLAVGAVFGQSSLTLALLPIAPIALLAGLAVEGLPLSRTSYQLSGGAWGAIGIALVLGGVVVLAFARSSGDARGVPWLALAVVFVAVVLLVFLWVQEVPRHERLPALVLLGGGLFLAFSLGSIGRLSYGGSPPGTEILIREETSPRLRPLFDDLNVMAMADASLALVYEPTTPIAVRWYGRYIAQVPIERSGTVKGIAIREAPPLQPGASAGSEARTPLLTISTLNRNDLHPLGILRWVATRKGLVEGHTRDIIVVQ